MKTIYIVQSSLNGYVQAAFSDRQLAEEWLRWYERLAGENPHPFAIVERIVDVPVMLIVPS